MTLLRSKGNFQMYLLTNISLEKALVLLLGRILFNTYLQIVKFTVEYISISRSIGCMVKETY